MRAIYQTGHTPPAGALHTASPAGAPFTPPAPCCILADASRTVRVGACDATATGDTMPTVTATASGLSYDAADDRYVCVWNTDTSWAWRRAALSLQLDDGATHSATSSFCTAAYSRRNARGGRSALPPGCSGR